MLEINYKKNIVIINPTEAKNLGIIKNFTREIIIDNNIVSIVWPRTNKVSKILSAISLKGDLMLKTKDNPNAKKYYKLCSNKENNFRRIIDLEIINGSKTTNNVKLNNLKMHQTDYKSNFILKSDKTISNLQQEHIDEKFNNFFEKNNLEVNHQNAQEIQEEIFDMNPIRRLSLDYKILGEEFLSIYEVTPEDQIKSLFNDVNNKLESLDNLPYVEIMNKNNSINN